ncbi:MAG: DNA recombination protein RmuC, partial [Clostridiales bacterium]|nr:DNA recombination protein RmuC [Clostridiales bacterium]
MRESNDKKLDEIRGVVDEKLQRTLNERFNENFKLISERLTEVYKGLGEMQSLAAGVGDLKRVLSNVKTRGNLGELQLGAILEEILAPEQYERNFDAKKNSGNERVEFAIKMPSDDNESLYLPIDSKFPADTYEALITAYDSGDPDLVATARKTLSDTLRTCAKSIRDKYINPPRTTDFAIMFLPAEGLYAEAVRLGLIEKLQHDYKINIAGPSTMAVLLNSLRLGFQTLAIQKRSGDIWKILTEIRKEFETFGEVLEKTQKSLNTANTELEKMIGVRTRQIIKTLNKASSLNPDNQSDKKLMIDLE